MLGKEGGNPDGVREEPGQVNPAMQQQQKAIAREQMQSNCIFCAVVTGSVIIVVLSMTAAILFGLYVENEKQVFKEMMEKEKSLFKEMMGKLLDEKTVHYDHTQLLSDFLQCKEDHFHDWDDLRKKVNDQCKVQATCDIEELVKCRERFDKVKTSVSEFVAEKDNEKPCEGVVCSIFHTLVGVVKDATD